MKINNLVYLILTAILIILTTTLIIMVASGYRLDLENKTIQGSGIIAVTSTPDGGLVLINDVPKDATNTSITQLQPGTYNVRIEKEGFASWKKDVIVEKELVTKVDALLIPKFPSFKPLTVTGANTPVFSPDQQKIIYQVTEDKFAGIWLMNLEERPFNLDRKPQSILLDSEEALYSEASLSWSPDSQYIIIKLQDREELFDLATNAIVSDENVAELKGNFAKQEKLQTTERIARLTEEEQKKLNTFGNIVWAPNDYQVFYSKENDNKIEYYVYILDSLANNVSISPTDSLLNYDPKKPFFTIDKETQHELRWFPDSKHILIAQRNNDAEATISVVEFDGTNQTHIFTGDIADLQAFPAPSGSKIVVLTKFNPSSENYNLYSINLR